MKQLMRKMRLRRFCQAGLRMLPAVCVFSGTLFLTPAQVYADIENTVTVSGFNGASPVNTSADEAVDVVNATTGISVLVSTDVSSVDYYDDDIVYTVRVTNAGNVTASAITVTDTLVTLVCPTSGDATIASLAPGAFEECTATYSTVQADYDLRGANDGSAADDEIDNTATANGTQNGGPVSGNDAHTVSITHNPSLSIVKTAVLNDEVNDNDVAEATETITYSFAVTNNGNVTMTNVSVNDTHNGTNGTLSPEGETISNDVAPTSDSTDPSGDNGSWDTLAPGDTITFTATYTVNQTDVDTLQ